MAPWNTTFEITFAIQSDAEPIHERITHVGGYRSDGSRWLIEQQIAIRAIESNTWQFFITHGGTVTEARIAHTPDGRKYLLVPGPDAVNLLLDLPQSPAPLHVHTMPQSKVRWDTPH